MSAWDDYPTTYRQSEVTRILAAVRHGGCAAVLGMSGAGKSNLVGFLAHRMGHAFPLVLVDCNRLSAPEPDALFRLIRRSLGDPQPAGNELDALTAAIQARLEAPPQRLAVLLDRFDSLPAAVHGSLRALRDDFKYQLSLVIAARRPPEPSSELAELFFASTTWLGPLAPEDARWSAQRFAGRHELVWDEETVDALVSLSGAYPSLLRAVCEAHADGAALDLESLLAHPAVQRRAAELLSGDPQPAELQASGLVDHPLLFPGGLEPGGLEPGSAALTAKEARLLEYLQAHPGQVCEKDDLIRAVWPEDKVFTEGIRDDSLAQLVRRLRRKLEPNPERPVYIQNVPGRGYQYHKPGG